jgi:hypothetical protein
LQARPPAEQGEAAWGTSGQVTIGMLEYWKTGILGFGKMKNWVIIKFLFTKIKYRNIHFLKSAPLKTGSLTFQYDIIPSFHYFYPVKLFSISPGPLFQLGQSP